MCTKDLEEIQERIKNIKTLEELEELEAAGIIEGLIYKDNFTPIFDAVIVDDDTLLISENFEDEL